MVFLFSGKDGHQKLISLAKECIFWRLWGRGGHTKNDHFVSTLSGFCAPNAAIESKSDTRLCIFCAWRAEVGTNCGSVWPRGCISFVLLGRDGVKSESYFREFNFFYPWGTEVGTKNETVLRCIQFILILTGRGWHQERIKLTDL